MSEDKDKSRAVSGPGATGRVCSKCGVWFSWDSFSPQRRGLNGRRAICKPCVVVYSTAWNKAHPEARKESKNRYYEKNRHTEIADRNRDKNADRQRRKREDPEYLERIWQARQNNLLARRRYEKNYQITKKYGITWTQYETLLEVQNGCCAICDRKLAKFKDDSDLPVANVDHDHDTGEVRGLLCSSCNSAIGYFRDNTALLHRAIGYLNDAPFKVLAYITGVK